MNRKILIIAVFLIGSSLAYLVVSRTVGEQKIKLMVYRLIYPKMFLENNTKCMEELNSKGLAIRRIADDPEQQKCAKKNVVRFKKLHILQNKPAELTCSMALSFQYFEEEVLQPLAHKHFQQPIKKLENWGSYDCRKVRNRNFWSQHSFANAIDIGGFLLADGTMVSVLKDWENAGKKSKFLQEVAKEGCDYFSKVLTPNFNKDHQDHFHFDQSLPLKCRP